MLELLRELKHFFKVYGQLFGHKLQRQRFRLQFSIGAVEGEPFLTLFTVCNRLQFVVRRVFNTDHEIDDNLHRFLVSQWKMDRAFAHEEAGIAPPSIFPLLVAPAIQLCTLRMKHDRLFLARFPQRCASSASLSPTRVSTVCCWISS